MRLHLERGFTITIVMGLLQMIATLVLVVYFKRRSNAPTERCFTRSQWSMFCGLSTLVDPFCTPTLDEPLGASHPFPALQECFPS